MNFFYFLTKSTLNIVFTIFYRHQTFGLEHVKPGKGIIAPNHVSFLDPAVIAISWPEEVAFLAKKSLFSSYLLRTLINNLNAYPVSGTSQDLNSLKLICKLLQKDQKVVIFPEGIRSRSGDLGAIKSGIGMLAIRNKCPIIPIYIHGTFDIWSRGHKLPKLRGKTACVIGSPIQEDQFNHLDKKDAQEAIAQSVKEAIEKLNLWYNQGAIGSPP